jgi:hypothetical protein
MDADTVGDVLYSTVLAKIVKSQQWMKATSTLPRDFIIFCWLPPVGAYQTCLEQTDALLWTEALLFNVRAGGWPFTLRLMVPFDPGSIFPANFGLNTNRNAQTKMDYYWSGLCYNVNAEDFQEAGAEEEEPMEWYLFAEDFDEVVEDVECKAKSSSPSFCMKALISLIDRMLESLQHRDEADWLAPAVLFHLVHGLETFVDPIVLAAFANDHPFAKVARSAGIREQDGPLKSSMLSPVTEGLPWWEIKGPCQEPLGLPGCFDDGFFVDPPMSFELCGSTKRHTIDCLTICF